MVMGRRRMHQKDAIILAGLLGGVLLLLFSPLWGPMIWRAPASFSEPVAVSGQATKKEEKKAIKMLKKLYTYYIENPDEMSAEYRQLMKKGESKTQVVCDYLAGMTDQYSMAKFRKIYIPKAWEVY